MNNREEIISLLKIVKKIVNKIKNSIIEENFLNQEISMIVERIIDLLGVKTDTSVEYSPEHPDYFRRCDYYTVIFNYIYEHHDYTVEEIYDMLVTLKEGD